MRKPVPDDGRFMKDEVRNHFRTFVVFRKVRFSLTVFFCFSVAGVGNPIGSDLGKRLGGGSVPAGFGFSGFVKTDCGPGAESTRSDRAEAWRVLQD